MPKVVIYTAIFGGYENDLPTINRPDERIDYICFTDSPIKTTHPWTVRQISRTFADAQRDARRLKLLPHLFLPEYDISLWIDGNLQLINYPMEQLLEDISQHPIARLKHPERGCIYQEGPAVLLSGYEECDLVWQQLYKYQSLGFPKNYGLTTTMFLLRKHNDPRCKVFCEFWWQELSKQSKRDQLSFDFVRWATQQRVKLLPYDCHGNDAFIWGKTSTGSHHGNRNKYRHLWAFPLQSYSGEDSYLAEEYFSKDFLIKAKNLLPLCEAEEKELLPLPMGLKNNDRKKSMRLLISPKTVLAFGKISLLWLLWALEHNPRLIITCIYKQQTPEEKASINYLQKHYKGKINFIDASPDDLLQTKEAKDIIPDYELIIFANTANTASIKQHQGMILKALQPKQLVALWGQGNTLNKDDLRKNLKRCEQFSCENLAVFTLPEAGQAS